MFWGQWGHSPLKTHLVVTEPYGWPPGLSLSHSVGVSLSSLFPGSLLELLQMCCVAPASKTSAQVAPLSATGASLSRRADRAGGISKPTPPHLGPHSSLMPPFCFLIPSESLPAPSPKVQVYSRQCQLSLRTI